MNVLFLCKYTKTVFLFAESRESAFVHALSSAALAHAVARACSRGELNECSCDSRVRKRTPRHWQWGGCSEVSYTAYGFFLS